MRVVFDTNIFISALPLPGGRAETALMRILDARDDLIISRSILQEVVSVLERKFAQGREELARGAVWLSEIATVVVPQEELRVLTDEADNRVLECAMASEANAIVTGDPDFLALGKFQRVRVLSLRAYLEEDEFLTPP